MRRLVLLLLLSVAGSPAMAYEEPDYEIVAEREGYEIRDYAPYVVAEVDVSGGFTSAGNRAFRILAGYIFGDNEPGQEMNMTIPVTSTGQGEKMDMTAPVESESTGEASWTYAFVMEKQYSLADLPKPNDDRIRLVERPARTMAVNRYSGSVGQRRYLKEEEELLAALQRDGVRVVGEPVFARYNGPFTLPFLRRNEVLVEIEFASRAPD